MSQCVLDPPTLRAGGPFSPLYMKLEASWTIFADFMVYKGLLGEQAKPHWIQWIQPFVDKSPIPVVTVFDFLWWCSFGFKYQHDLNRIFYNNNHERIPDEMVNRIFNFYDTAAFSQWSMPPSSKFSQCPTTGALSTAWIATTIYSGDKDLNLTCVSQLFSDGESTQYRGRRCCKSTRRECLIDL